ncbi:hypothetical protein Moror_5263 [Moniliophthora roreri MCA 2997]|uniref:Uncharacterized protein n=1 Tax=Moniliophthora roreri (strain MCA 2997) TaxID=1381753 RepID=V2X8P7_MONRO|nr:hypothetical protein Moror_5263 [Moniliophthora roreri MCA 2997]
MISIAEVIISRYLPTLSFPPPDSPGKRKATLAISAPPLAPVANLKESFPASRHSSPNNQQTGNQMTVDGLSILT